MRTLFAALTAALAFAAPASALVLPGTVVFNDDFNGAEGAPANPAKWWTTPWCSTGAHDLSACFNQRNVYQDGAGHLVLRVSRGTMGRPYDAAQTQTYLLGQHPPTRILAKLTPPVHVETSAKIPALAGLWTTFWPMGVASYSPPIELDVSEIRTRYPTFDGCYVHGPTEGHGSYTAPASLALAFHKYWANYYRNRVDFGVDGNQCGSVALWRAEPVGIRLSNTVGPPGSWAAWGGQAPLALLPADYVVAYVKAWTLCC